MHPGPRCRISIYLNTQANTEDGVRGKSEEREQRIMRVVLTVLTALMSALFAQGIWFELDERRCMIHKLHASHILHISIQILNMQDKAVR